MSDILFSIIPSRTNHVVSNGNFSLLMTNIPLCMYFYHIFFLHLSVSGYLSCIHVLVIINNAAKNTEVCMSF